MSERPRNSAAVTADWLNEVLHQNGVLSQARVAGVSAADLGTGLGLMGEVVRLSIDYDQAEEGAPATMIGKFPAKDPTNLGVATSLFFYPREVAFYTQLAQHSPIRTPALYHADLDMSDHGFVLLMEDLAEATPGDQVVGTTPEQTQAAMAAIGKLHGAWFDKVDGEEMAALFDFANPEFGAAVQAGYEGFLGPALENFSEFFSDYTKETARALGPKTAQLLAEANGERRTFIHGDYRADNLMFHPDLGDDGVAAVDWQISGRGNGLYDVAYLICNSVPYDYRKEAEERLLRQYHDTLIEMGAQNYSFEECWTDYRRAVLAGLFVVIYTCGGMDLGNERGLAFVKEAARRVNAAVTELQAGEMMPA